MDLQQLLAALLNPNGSQQAGAAPAMAGSVPQVGDHANPALLQQAMARFQQPQQAPQPIQPPQKAPQVAQQPSAPMQQPPQAPQSGGIGDFLTSVFAPKQAGKNMTIDYLQKQGLDAGTARILASDKTALRSYLLRGGQKSDFDQRAAAAQQYGIDPSTPEGRNFILTGKLGEDAAKPTSDIQEYEFAKQQGFPGSFMDFQVKMREAGRNQVNIDTGTKLPTGYMWNDPADQSKGVKPIPGGPATQIPSEAAGRIGLADTFLQNFDGIREKVASGQITGPIDRARAANDSSYAGAETYRQIKTGVDSLQRMLTGAGMPASEAEAYAYRYLPTYTDDANSMTAKLDRLKTELESVKSRVLQGRGGNPDQTERPQQPQTDQGGDTPPASYDGDPNLWKYMTPEQRKLWQ